MVDDRARAKVTTSETRRCRQMTVTFAHAPAGTWWNDTRDELEFNVEGLPIPKARARVVRQKDGSSRAYTPGHTRAWENHIRLQTKVALAGRPPLLGPLYLELFFHLPIPAGIPK